MRTNKVATGASILILLGVVVLSWEHLRASCISPNAWTSWEGVSYRVAVFAILLGGAILFRGWWLLNKETRHPLFLVTEKQGIRFLIAAIALAVAVLILRQCFEMNVANAIYLTTGFVLLWYTVETCAMRWQMVRQNELTVRQNELAVLPLVLATVENRSLGVSTYGLQVVLRNIGWGPALFVQVDDFAVHEIEGTKTVLLSSIPPVDCIEPEKDAALPVEAVIKEEGKEVHRNVGSARLNYVAMLHPQVARETYEITVRYEDIDRLGHWAKIQMGKGGIRLLDHGRETKQRRGEHA